MSEIHSVRGIVAFAKQEKKVGDDKSEWFEDSIDLYITSEDADKIKQLYQAAKSANPKVKCNYPKLIDTEFLRLDQFPLDKYTHLIRTKNVRGNCSHFTATKESIDIADISSGDEVLIQFTTRCTKDGAYGSHFQLRIFKSYKIKHKVYAYVAMSKEDISKADAEADELLSEVLGSMQEQREAPGVGEDFEDKLDI